MPTSKHKNAAQKPLKALPFALAWAFASLLSALVTVAFSHSDPTSYLSVKQIVILALLRGAPLTAFFQVQLIERVFQRSMRGWLLYTLLAALITVPMTLQPPGINLALILFVPTALFQTMWLWRRVNKPWLWPLITGIGAFVVSQIIYLPGNGQFLRLSLPVCLAFLYGFVMYYLLAHPKETEKTDSEVSALSDHMRLQRLQESEHTDSLWDIGDEQTLQSEM